MALLDTPQSMYGSMTSQYLIQNGYTRNSYYRDYEQDALARLNLQQRLHSSPEQPHYDLHARLFVKEERLASIGENYNTAFKPYASVSPDQENVSHHANTQNKVNFGFTRTEIFIVMLIVDGR